jgi:hypothetical protein
MIRIKKDEKYCNYMLKLFIQFQENFEQKGTCDITSYNYLLNNSLYFCNDYLNLSESIQEFESNFNQYRITKYIFDVPKYKEKKIDNQIYKINNKLIQNNKHLIRKF